MQLYQNSLAIQVLSYLNKTGGIPRKNLYIPFSDYDYVRYTRTIKRLIDEGYLELYRYKSLNHIKLSEKGLKELKQKLDNDPSIEKNRAKPKDVKAKKRLLLVNDALGLCKAAGIQTDTGEGKPPIELLFRATVDREDIENLEESFRSGIFYSTGEIRKEYIRLYGKNEIMNLTRLIGVILHNGVITYLYSMGNKLIKWMPSCEGRSAAFIQSFFKRSLIISEYFEIESRPNCIVCGRGMANIPKLVYGRAAGRYKEEDNSVTKGLRAKNATDHINAHNIAKVYATAYYVPVNVEGAQALALASVLNYKTKEMLCAKWFENHNEYIRLKSDKYFQGVSKTDKSRVIYMPYIDLIELEYYKNQDMPAHVVCPKGNQEGISRVMGPLMTSAESLSGIPLKFNRYDKSGTRVKTESDKAE